MDNQRMSVEYALGKFKGEYITWTNSFSMGIRLIDDQHKGLLDFVNNLFAHASGNEEEEEIYFKGVIHQAVDYIKVHFATEEKYMLATNYTGYAEHKKAHDEFILTIIKTAKDFEAGKRLTLEKLAHFLKDWILSHIAVMDKRYSDYFWKIASRKPDGKLTITAADINRSE